MPTTRLGFGGPVAAYLPFLAKSEFFALTDLILADAFIEFRLDTGFQSDAFQADAFGGEEFSDVTLDVIEEPLVIEYGIRSNDPSDRVAGSGFATFAMDNSEYNEIQQLAYYSMFRDDRRPGFDFNMTVRVSLRCTQVNENQRYYKFYGGLEDAPSTPGRYEDRLTRVRALDIFDDYGRIDEPDLPVQINKRADEILEAILDGATAQPVARDIDTGSETYTVALDGGTGQKLKVRERIQQLGLSEFGFCYTVGGPVQAGTLRFENRQHRASNPEVMFHLDNTMLPDGISVPSSRGDLYSKVSLSVWPTNNLVTATPIVLYSLQTTHILVQPGETNDTLFGPYRDPSVSNQPIGGDTTSMSDPVATTDYTMNTAQDGSGVDLTANFTVTTSRTGTGVKFFVTNNGAQAGYVTKLQQQGVPIYRYEALLERETATPYGDRLLTYVMPFQNNINVGQDARDFLANVHGRRVSRPRSVRFLANIDADHMEAALVLEPGSRIAISEEVNGLDEAEFTINGVRLELYPGGILYCTWFLEPGSSQQFWLIGVEGASNIGLTTRPGF